MKKIATKATAYQPEGAYYLSTGQRTGGAEEIWETEGISDSNMIWR
jgi:hypothetical protein